ncbi:MAG: MarR family transcriptional regulator [Rhodococcus sp.]|nr:MarR family transcriptional regulator [Rhodococcus sp. (in: high G+C Gram-positive bacteria)]
MVKKLETDFEDAGDSPGLMLWRVTNAWQASIRAALRPFDLTHVQFVLLAALTWLDAETPITQRDLAEYARTDPMMTSQVIRTLESKKLVERRPHPTDARARSVVVTQGGAALAGKANRAVEASDREFFAALGDRQAAFVAMLGMLDRK